MPSQLFAILAIVLSVAAAILATERLITRLPVVAAQLSEVRQ